MTGNKEMLGEHVQAIAMAKISYVVCCKVSERMLIQKTIQSNAETV